ncbi:MAG: restriction endonuclease subunit S, partial [Pontibacter sp.]|nr:restriction endonuclease subunit S [Pontibacter sp.]
MERELPEGWVEVEVSEVFDVRDGTHDSPKYNESGFALVTSKNIKNGLIDLYNVNYISEEDYLEINKRSKVDKGDLLFSMIGTIGNSALITEEPNYAIKNVALFKPINEVKSKFLGYYLNAPKVQDKMLKEAKGTTQKFVGLGYLRTFPLILPPLAEQKRIVAKLDEAFQHLDTLRARLERIPELLKNFRQSVLTQAVTGKLTKDWREENSDIESAQELLNRIRAERIKK